MADDLYRQCLAALIEAKRTIRTWHDMGSNCEGTAELWAIYDTQSPEMMRINAAIRRLEAVMVRGEE